MRLTKNLSAAWQVIAAQPGRAMLLALPVAVSTALALATLAPCISHAEECLNRASFSGREV